MPVPLRAAVCFDAFDRVEATGRRAEDAVVDEPRGGSGVVSEGPRASARCDREYARPRVEEVVGERRAQRPGRRRERRAGDAQNEVPRRLVDSQVAPIPHRPVRLCPELGERNAEGRRSTQRRQIIAFRARHVVACLHAPVVRRAVAQVVRRNGERAGFGLPARRDDGRARAIGRCRNGELIAQHLTFRICPVGGQDWGGGRNRRSASRHGQSGRIRVLVDVEGVGRGRRARRPLRIGRDR